MAHLAPRSRFYHKIFLLPLLIDLVTLWFKEHAPMILFPTSATHISTSMKLCVSMAHVQLIGGSIKAL